MEYPKLYKRTATGAVQVWWQERNGGQYRTHSGQDGGQIVTSEWTQAKPKNVGRSNETTADTQARLEVESNYARKRKDGYRDSVGAAKHDDRFSPMLAKPFDDYAAKLKLSEGAWCQPKLDGIRCIATSTGLWSRKGDRIVSCPHIERALAPFFKVFPDIRLDGELYNHLLKDNFNEITSLVKTLKPSEEHLIKTAEIVQYHIYDAPRGDDTNYAVRFGRIVDIVDDVGLPLVTVPTFFVTEIDQLDMYYDNFLGEGYEGQMVRLEGPYESKRSKLLLKRKEFVDSEFEVLDILEGEGNASGGAKIAWLRLDTDPSKKFKADVVGTKAERVQILKDKDKLIGKMATVKYFKQRTPAGIPRFGKIKLIHESERW